MTRQVGDNLILNGEQYKLLGSEDLPENDTRVLKLTDAELELRYKDTNKDWLEIRMKIDLYEKASGESYVMTESENNQYIKHLTHPSMVCSSTACHRGYLSTWEINDGVLYLNGIIGRYELTTDDAIIADWYNDTLKVPTGEMLNHDIVTPLGDIYESEIHLEIEKGRVVNTEIIDRRDEYQSIYGSLNDMTREEAIEKLRRFAEADDE